MDHSPVFRTAVTGSDMRKVIGLIATRPRLNTLLAVSLPSIAAQHRPPDSLIIVSDRVPLAHEEQAQIGGVVPGLDVIFLANVRPSGVANTWNTGLAYIQERWPDAYVAILDDDDTWDANHLESCYDSAKINDWPDVVLSGLRMKRSGAVTERPIATPLTCDLFLIGNPGWQGSNTFALGSCLADVGNFTEGLSSCNDRDLAIRILTRKQTRLTVTGRTTATWNLGLCPDALSLPGPHKRAGLRRFYALHNHRMTDEVRQQFFERTQTLFGLGLSDLV
jgi:hypothetical protein